MRHHEANILYASSNVYLVRFEEQEKKTTNK